MTVPPKQTNKYLSLSVSKRISLASLAHPTVIHFGRLKFGLVSGTGDLTELHE